MFRAVDEVGATLNAALVVMGDKLGLYRALAGAGPLDAGRAGASAPARRERYVREWLNAQAAGGYVEYDPDERPLHAAARAGRSRSPTRTAPPTCRASSRSRSARCSTRRGSPRRPAPATGIGWHEHVPRRVRGLRALLPARLQRQPASRPGCRRSTASSRSSSAARTVADVGCGHGASTILMAQAFPNSTFVGFDYHEGSIETARARAAEEAGVADRVRFEVAPAAGVLRARATTS